MNSIFFDVAPMFVPADKPSTIIVRPLYAHVSFNNRQDLNVQVVRDDGIINCKSKAEWAKFTNLDFKLHGNAIHVSHQFDGEHEFTFQITHKNHGKEQLLEIFRIFSLKPDLFALRPFKGDFHLHSFCSDGKESPAYVAASCRKIGMDFMALTDHRQYQPSLDAIAAMQKLPTDLRCYPGEETHPPNNPAHIINFGGKFSINALFAENAPYHEEVKSNTEKLHDVPETWRHAVASSEWCFDKIREAGGIAVFCHPYWKPVERYDLPCEITEALMRRRMFDALEVIGGFDRHQMESNALAVAHLHEERMRGREIPVVGLSDSHGCDRNLFGWYYTIVFASSVEFRDLASAIRNARSVAVEAVPGEFPRIVGPFRFVRYAYFLLREYFPLHDQLCAKEGQEILAHLAGDKHAAARLASMQGQTPALWERLWAEQT